MTHTPGPWDWDHGVVPPDGCDRYANIYADGGDVIIANFNDLIPQGVANARLIAVAPNMLEALRAIVALPYTSGEPYPDAMWFRAVDIARDVLAKAGDL